MEIVNVNYDAIKDCLTKINQFGHDLTLIHKIIKDDERAVNKGWAREIFQIVSNSFTQQVNMYQFILHKNLKEEFEEFCEVYVSAGNKLIKELDDGGV